MGPRPRVLVLEPGPRGWGPEKPVVVGVGPIGVG